MLHYKVTKINFPRNLKSSSFKMFPLKKKNKKEKKEKIRESFLKVDEIGKKRIRYAKSTHRVD